MNKRKEALSKAKLEIFKELIDSKDTYKNYSPKEKLEFIERAFNNVNNYYSNILFGLNPNNTKFGFMIGNNAGGTAYYNNRAIGFNLKLALENSNPFLVYKLMFHEMQHTWHHNASLYKKEIPIISSVDLRNTKSTKIPKPIKHFLINGAYLINSLTTPILKPFKLINAFQMYNSKDYTLAMHQASLNEIDADNSAFKNIHKIIKEGIKKSSFKQLGFGMLKRNKEAWRNNRKTHLKAIANVVSFGKLFSSVFQERMKNTHHNKLLNKIKFKKRNKMEFKAVMLTEIPLKH